MTRTWSGNGVSGVCKKLMYPYIASGDRNEAAGKCGRLILAAQIILTVKLSKVINCL